MSARTSIFALALFSVVVVAIIGSAAAATGARQLWQTKIGTTSGSSPYLDKEKNWLYVNGATEVAILDAASGSVVKKVSSSGHTYGNSNIVKVDTRVYYTAAASLICAGSATFKPIWMFNASGEFADTPLYVDSMKAIFVGNDGNANMYKINAASGKLLWQTKFPGSDVFFQQPGYSSKYNLVFGGSNSFVVAFDATTGKIGWQYQAVAGRVQTNAVFSDDQEAVYFGSDGGTAYSFHTATGKVNWQFDNGANFAYYPLLRDGVLYLGDGGSENCFALDATTGKQIWKVYCNTVIADAGPSRFYGDTILYGAGSSRFGITAIAINGSGIVWNWTNATDNVFGMSVPTADGIIYVSDNSANFYALQLPPSGNGVKK